MSRSAELISVEDELALTQGLALEEVSEETDIKRGKDGAEGVDEEKLAKDAASVESILRHGVPSPNGRFRYIYVCVCMCVCVCVCVCVQRKG